LTSPNTTLALLPARSEALPLADWPKPSLERVTGGDTEATPDSESVAEKETVTGELFHPLALANGYRLAVSFGAVRSILIPDTARLAVLPALSRAETEACWFAPSLEKIVALGQ